MNNERIAQLLSYAEKHLKHPKIFNFRSFTERILLKVEHVVNDLHDDGVLTPSEEMIKLLNRMCTRVYDLSVHCLKKVGLYPVSPHKYMKNLPFPKP